MTTRFINIDAREAKALHDGAATAVLRRREPQPADHGDRWERRHGEGSWAKDWAWLIGLKGVEA